MAAINIPSSLTTSTQLPVDSKTYRQNLSEITTVTSENAFTYYVGMRVDVAETNKQYVWKPINDLYEAVSNTFTYPANHVVDGYNYGDKIFAFYEVVIDAVLPPEDNKVSYRTNVTNIPFVDLTSPTTTRSYLYHSKVVGDPDVNNVAYEDLSFMGIASNTLNIFRKPANPATPDIENTVWIEYRPQNSVIIGDIGQYETIGEALANGHTDLVLQPTPTRPIFTITEPIASNIKLAIPDGVVLENISGGPILQAGPGVSQFLTLADNATLVTNSPIANIGSNNSSVVIVGGKISASNLTTPLITGSAGASSVLFKDLILDLSNTSMASINDSNSITLSNSNISATSSTKSLITANNARVDIDNAVLGTVFTSSNALLDLKGTSTVNMSNVTASGALPVMAKIDTAGSSTPNISINNSDLGSLNTTHMFEGSTPETMVNGNSFKINNTLVPSLPSVISNTTGVKTTNIIDNGVIVNNPSTGDGVSQNYVDTQDGLLGDRISSLEGMLPVDLSNYATIDVTNGLDARVTQLESGAPVVTIYPEYPTREQANSELEKHSLFINTNNDNEDKATWFIDVAIP